jgi:hypothetical protein
LLLDPLFYAMGFRNAIQEQPPAKVIAVARERPELLPRKERPAPSPSIPPVRQPTFAPPVDRQLEVAPHGAVSEVVPAAARKPDCPVGTKECPRPK